MNPELIWRPLARTDIPAMARLLAAAEAVDRTSEHLDEADLSEEVDDESLDLATDTVGVFEQTALVGLGLVRGHSVARDVHNVQLWGAVHPDKRGQGIGRGILAHQLHRGAHLHAERHPTHRGRLELRPYDHCEAHVRLARAAGLSPVRHWFDMERDLSGPLPAVPPAPAGLRVVPYSVDLDDDVRRAHNAAFADHFGATERDQESWRQWFTGSRAFRPELSTIVLDGPEVVAFLLSYFYEADAAADGFAEGWIGQVGTVPAQRRQGIGTTLIAGALTAYREAGFSRAALDADSDSGTGGLGIYHRLGFTVARKRTSYVRELPAAEK